ncbi:MAG: hypothetical protein EXR78_05215 [Deltaproteobacteria bacterium]|nr:hypothetical protein [Deltaproteobacteria bacterium]
MQTRLVLGMTCLIALMACRPNTPSPLPQTSSASHPPRDTSKTNSMDQPAGTRERIAPAMSPTELKYRALDLFPNPFACDPDEYPVARADAADLAKIRFRELQANSEEFQVILRHTGLSGSTTFSDAQIRLIDREYQKLQAISLESAGNRYQFQLQISESKQEDFLIKGIVDNDGIVTVQEREPSVVTCPVCLAPQTQIATPTGPVAVADLRVGDAVWTADMLGTRLAATIEKTVRVPAPSTHRMIHVVLEDGRALWSSPGHPTVNEQRIADLRVGDFLSGGRITRLEEEPYKGSATHDILPSGRTGYYWANGILIGSTLVNGQH